MHEVVSSQTVYAKQCLDNSWLHVNLIIVLC